MVYHKRPWIRHYPSQMQIYLLMGEHEYGVFILKNKSTGLLKVIDVYLDYEHAESLLGKAERINAHVENNTLPDPINDAEICSNCAFRHICLPDIGEGLEFIKEKEVIERIDEYFDLKQKIKKSDIPEMQKRIKELEGHFKMWFKDRPSLMVGVYLVTGKWQTHGNGEYWKVSIAHPNL